jgi:hypothetical protein
MLSPEDYPAGLELHRIGADRAMWPTDYSHLERTFALQAEARARSQVKDGRRVCYADVFTFVSRGTCGCARFTPSRLILTWAEQ